MQEPLIIKIKPISVNECWQGQRFKTIKYKTFEKSVLLLLPQILMPNPPYKISYEFGFSNSLSDFDNPVKPITDILQKKYKINDKHIYQAIIQKRIVKIGQEYFSFQIEHLEL